MIFVARREVGFLLKSRYGLYWMACAGNIRSPSDVATKALSIAFATIGSKAFLEAGKKRLSREVACQETSGEIASLTPETRDLKEAPAETMLENRLFKKA